MDRDGSHLRSLNITKISTYNQQPTYMPDGKSLLFLAGTETSASGSQAFSLWQVNVDGSHAHRVADESLFLNPSRWKPRAPEPTNLKSVRAVLAAGASPGTRDAMGRSMLSNAASRGDVERSGRPQLMADRGVADQFGLGSGLEALPVVDDIESAVDHHHLIGPPVAVADHDGQPGRARQHRVSRLGQLVDPVA